jgi:HEAT repeat protein
LLRDKNAAKRQFAVLSLEKLCPDPEAALPALNDAARDPDTTLRVVALRLRRRLDGKNGPAVEGLTDLLKDAGVRYAAMGALGRMGADAKAAAPALAELVKGADRNARLVAAGTLERIGPEAKAAVPALVELLKEKDSVVRLRATAALLRVGAEPKDVVPGLADAVRDLSVLTELRNAEALRRYGNEAEPLRPALRDLLGHADVFTRLAAAELLWQLDPAEKDAAVPVLLEALTNPAPAARLGAAAALCRVDPDNPRGPAALTAALADPDPFVRQEAARAVGRVGPDAKALLPALSAILEDEEAPTRVTAAFAVWKVGQKADKATAACVACLKASPCATFRAQAALVLGEIGPDAKDAVPALRDALKDRNRGVRVAAAEALRKVDAEAAAKAGVP